MHVGANGEESMSLTILFGAAACLAASLALAMGKRRSGVGGWGKGVWCSAF